MKKIYLVFLFVLAAFSAHAQNDPFITTWEVTSTDLSITIPVNGTGYNYTVDFGDGTIQNNMTGNVSHTYESPGVYTVNITSTFLWICFGCGNYNDQQLQTIEQWGDIQWASMKSAFERCVNLVINATDTPDLSSVTNMSSMFEKATSFNQSINNWDVSNVTDMDRMFKGANSFNQSLNGWDVSNVTEMDRMFMNAKTFDQPLNNWDVSNVTNMFGMFSFADFFNQSLNNWDVSSVTNMGEMFFEADSFNQPINNWNVSNVTDMSSMFTSAISFNQPIDNWNVSNVYGSGMNFMFSGAESFNQPLNNWDISNLTTMEYMFSYAESFNQFLNNWDVSNVTNMTGLFKGAISFDQPLGMWNVSNVTNMNNMFTSASSFNQELNEWNVSTVTSMGGMFGEADSFNQPLNNWDVSNVTNMHGMFSQVDSFNQPLNNWVVSSATDLEYMFFGASSFNQNLSNWQINSINLSYFISDSNLDVNNYNAFLSHLATLGTTNGQLGADGLEYCNQAAHDYLVNTMGWTITGDNLSSNCDSYINGTIVYDITNNGCDSNDANVNGIMVHITGDTYDFSTLVQDGNYLASVSGTDFTVSVINYPDYFIITPASATVTFTTSDTEQVDFCVTANQNIEDLNITLLPINQARPGFEADYRLVIQNIGTQTFANVSATLNFDNSKQSFATAVPSPTSTTADQLTFEMADLLPFEIRTVDLTMQTFEPPTVNGGDILNFTASVTPNANDYTPNDNTFNFEQIVVNSYDPNDKQVLQGEEIFIEEADEYLNYLIRFQNTGTASAINVRVLDTLHPKLDWNTIKPVSASHDYRVEITDGNHVEFIFENINLPHEAADEPGSHGFIAYKIKPLANVEVGDVITGDASIYFDFNAPIITNTVSTEIVEDLEVADNTALTDQIILYPNPADKELHVQLAPGILMEKITIYNLQGQEIQRNQSETETINVEKLTSGMYLLKIETDKGTLVRQLIKN